MCACGGLGGDFFFFFKHRGVDNYGLNECSQSASLSVCKKRKAQRKPLQGRLITPRKRGNINGRFCGYNVTAKRLNQPQHVKQSHSYFWRLLAALSTCVYVCVRVCAFSPHMRRICREAEDVRMCLYANCMWVWFVCRKVTLAECWCYLASAFLSQAVFFL